MSRIRRFLAWNERLSLRLRDWGERRFGRRCGMVDFRARILPGLLAPGLNVLDVGGGKFPLVPAAIKAQLRLRVTGLDISSEELAQAPVGSYDEMLVGDVATLPIPGTFDLIVSHTVLEHVRQTPAAIANLSGALRSGGTMAHFIPCANAGYAIVNRALGNRISRGLLWSLYPESRATSGYRAYYRHCTPRAMGRLCQRSGLEIADLVPYFASDYCRFFAPLYAAEMARQLILRQLGLSNLAEGFTIIARKRAESAASPARRAA